jgi:hypothetical protein
LVVLAFAKGVVGVASLVTRQCWWQHGCSNHRAIGRPMASSISPRRTFWIHGHPNASAQLEAVAKRLQDTVRNCMSGIGGLEIANPTSPDSRSLAGLAISTALCAETFDLQKMTFHLRLEVAFDVF